MSLSNLIYDFSIKNELENAKEYLEIGLKKSDQSTNYWLKSMIIGLNQVTILELEREYEKLEGCYIKLLDLASQENNSLKLFEVNLGLFSFYINRFSNTENKEYITKAREIEKKLVRIKNENNGNVVIQRLYSYSNAMLLRFGSLKQRMKSMEIYEDLCSTYPAEPKFKINLIELLWDDLAFDIDGDSKKKIDMLIEELEQ